MLCHYAAKSCDHKHCDGGDIMFLICHVTYRKQTLQNHMMERPGNFMSENSPWYINTFPSLMAIHIAVVEI